MEWWHLLISFGILGFSLYSCHTLRFGYLPGGMFVEDVCDWYHERKRKKKG